MRRPFTVSCLVVVAATLHGQSFNIDFDHGGINNPIGHLGVGPPSNAFGGAAGQTGQWIQLTTLKPGPSRFIFKTVEGQVTAVRMLSSATGIGNTGTNVPEIHTGDHKLLMNDTWFFDHGDNIQFLGLSNGRYRVVTYACHMSSQQPAFIDVTSSIGPNPQLVTGPSPGNSFALGVTHADHEVDVTGGTITVTLTRQSGGGSVGIQGLQITRLAGPQSIFAPGPVLSDLCR